MPHYLRYSVASIWLIGVSFSASAQAPLTPAPSLAAAPAPAAAPPHASLQLSPQGARTPVTVSSDETGTRLQIGRLKTPLTFSKVSDIQAEIVVLKGGAAIGVLRVTGDDRHAALLLKPNAAGEFETLWTGYLDFHGDPGERRADALEIADRDGDGARDIVVGVYDEQVHVCGDDRTLLAPRAVDPKTLRLRSVLLNRAAARQTSQQLVAATIPPPGATPPPLLAALRLTGTSSAETDPQHAAAALSDGDLATSWLEGRGLGGRFEFATFRWSASHHPIVALAVTPTAVAAVGGKGVAAPASARARVLSLLGPGKERLVATLPEEPRPGQRYWIVPASPLAWSCLTISLDDVSGAEIGPKTHSGLAEVEAYSDVDMGGGLAALIAELAHDGAAGDDATELLSRARGDVVSALQTGWPTLSVLGKQRALRLLFDARPIDPRAFEVLRTALSDPDPGVNRKALALAQEHATGGANLLIELSKSATSQGDQAAIALAHGRDPERLHILLAALLQPGGSERPQLREAIAVAFQGSGESAASTLAEWSQAPQPLAARAALALALSHAAQAREFVQTLVLASLKDSTQFADQWRLVQASEGLAAEPLLDAWLSGLAHDANAWMLRAAALDALSARHAPDALTQARKALNDTYPRVRATALHSLAHDPAAFELLAQAAHDDKWFLVRQAALDNLPDSTRARVVWVSAIKDRTPTVRAAAVRALAHAHAAEAFDQIQPLLDNAQEYPEVIAEAVAFAKGLCVSRSAPSLQAVAVRGLKPDAWSADQELALSALDALSSLGGESAKWAHDHAEGPLVPKAVQSAAAAAVAKPASCRPDQAL
jgi:hypothetical protein